LMTTTFGGDAGGSLCAVELPRDAMKALMSSSTGRYFLVVFVIELVLYTYMVCRADTLLHFVPVS
jgi:hypothetical protein